MTRFKIAAFVAIATLVLFSVNTAHAHFGMVIPSDDIVVQGESSDIGLDLMFIHPFEGHYMNLVKPARFGVFLDGRTTDLLPTLRQVKKKGFITHKANFRVRRPGDYSFFMVPKPYWEPAEDCYIVHYTKVLVAAYEKEEGWDEPVGLKTEIIPLTRPYALYAGNAFTGRVLVDGKPAAGCDVEVEYYNKDGRRKAPSGSFVTQVVKTDSNGVFTYVAPWAGWWGFAGLNTSDKKLKGKDVELGAVLWVKFHEPQ